MTTTRPTFTQQLLAGGPLVLPGVGTPLEAAIAVATGFESLYLSGYATAGWQTAKPDIGLIGLREMLDCLVPIRARFDLPILVDADTGYGDVVNVADTVRRLEQAGASGVQLEDQTWPKRCGHLAGKTVEPAEVMVRKLRAAVAARRDPDTFIVARTDARAPLGLDEAIRRGQLYAETGVDLVFVDAPESLAELARIGREIPGRLMVNMSESGLTPAVPAARLAELGFDVIIYPTGALRVATAAISQYFSHLRRAGDSIGAADDMVPFGEFNALLGIAEYQGLEDRLQ
jgi:2-methylisocitrate lyase-like PEP mutase family enzyme